MSAIVEGKHKGSSKQIHEYFAVCKGAPEVVENLLHKVPHNYESLYKEYVKGGYRVLSLAYKSLSSISESSMK